MTEPNIIISVLKRIFNEVEHISIFVWAYENTVIFFFFLLGFYLCESFQKGLECVRQRGLICFFPELRRGSNPPQRQMKSTEFLI